MATITGKRFQITDGASTPTNLFPYTVSEAVYGLSNTISNAISTALSALSLSTYAGTSAIGSATQPVYYNGSALVAADLSTTYAPYNYAGYLPLSAGGNYPLTGNLVIQGSGDAKLVLDNTDTETNYQYISFRQNGTEYGRLGVFSVGTTNLQWYAGGVAKTIIHSGNYSSYALPLTGGTLTGSLKLEADGSSANFVKNITFLSNTTWARALANLQVDGTTKFTIAAYGNYTPGGSDNGINYAYIGVNSYDGTNLRFGSDSTLKWGTNTIFHQGNANLSTVSWACSTLTASSKVTVNAGGSIRVITTGAQTAIHIGQAGGANAAAGDILFQNGDIDRNGFKISSEMDSYAAMQRLVFYSSANGTSPYTATWKEAMRISSAGHVSIGTTSSNSNLTVNGNIVATGAITAGSSSSSSDARLKSNIKPFSYSSDLLLALKPREWDWNEYSHLEGHSAGIVAQEIQGLMPYAVGSVSDEKFGKHLTMNYDTLHALEIAGLQNHESRIRQLEAENRELRKRLNMN